MTAAAGKYCSPDAAVDIHFGDLFEKGSLVGILGFKKPCELTLRKHHRAAELSEVETNGKPYLGTDLTLTGENSTVGETGQGVGGLHELPIRLVACPAHHPLSAILHPSVGACKCELHAPLATTVAQDVARIARLDLRVEV